MGASFKDAMNDDAFGFIITCLQSDGCHCLRKPLLIHCLAQSSTRPAVIGTPFAIVGDTLAV